MERVVPPVILLFVVLLCLYTLYGVGKLFLMAYQDYRQVLTISACLLVGAILGVWCKQRLN